MGFPKAFALALITAVVTHHAEGTRIQGPFWATVHCYTATEGEEQLCWQGPSSEGRLRAICGGSELQGACSSDGYTCDVSGASLDRFTLFLGLSAFAKPSEAGACTDKDVDLKKAMTQGALQNNQLCPSLLKGVREWHEDIRAQLANVTTAMAGCAEGVRSGGCVQVLTDLVVPTISDVVFESIEEHLGIEWAKKLVDYYDAAPMIQEGARLADKFVDIPEGVTAFAAKLHLSLKEPVVVAKALLREWHGVKETLSKPLEAFLKPMVHPMMSAILDQFPEAYEDNADAVLAQGKKMAVFQTALNEQVYGALDNVQALCVLANR